jgi:pyridoxal phosphate enzyme (YggS family)
MPLHEANMDGISRGLQAVRVRVAAAAQSAGRDSRDVAIVAVSKTFPAAAVAEAAHCGQTDFGENYAQEGIDKMQAVRALLTAAGAAAPPALAWHFIGPIQSNKTRAIATHFDWVHSVDRLKVAQRLNDARAAGAAPLNVCIQVNVSGEATKSGVTPSEAQALVHAVAALPRLRLRGLMTVPRETADAAGQRAQFRALRELRDRLAGSGLRLETLSMGMSDDLEAAVAEGATLVRVGRAIFGARPRNAP